MGPSRHRAKHAGPRRLADLHRADLVDADADREMNWVIDLIENVRSARAQIHVPAGAKVPLVVTGMDAKGQSAWDNNER